MNRTARLIGIGVVVAMSVVAFAALAPVTLKYSPKVGDDPHYKMTGSLDMSGTPVDISADMDYKITKVDPDGTYTTLINTANMTAVVNGSAMPSPPDTQVTTVSKANGELVDFQTNVTNPDGWRSAELNKFVYPDKPVNVGDSWTSTVASDSKKGAVAATCTFTLDSLEKVGSHDTAKIKVVYKETEGSDPASSDGYVWLDTKDGTLVKESTKWSNAPSPVGPINASIEINRAE